ncbi:FMN-binding negative transcriptional regulator [Litorilituus lipolyticus]|uniref:FMN-binding negative transcriptional regulator n=1 Tax=Litorilituus lipolyticus TaxID=2491017 RepID=A0A502L503_9GAMM|nr:FMN-binding negative transcriptional regulator [Litorilituus lipolyticus]TPH18019.1 FMN-binding negative transcriptional regulator [Litorilituus lipolyticus]
MYPNKHFSEHKNQQLIKTIIDNNPLATVVFMQNQGGEFSPHVSHIPFHFASASLEKAPQALSKLNLSGHVSNQHPLALQLMETAQIDITLIFHGGDHYISPNYFGEENRTAHNVPTWNYANIHVQGSAFALTDEQQRRHSIQQTSEHFEQDIDINKNNSLWRFQSIPEKAITQMLNAITLLNVEITDIRAHCKMSQNKPDTIKASIEERLINDKQSQLAHYMSLIRGNN